MEIIGYIASIFIGISLGLIGGGGSILTVPVLVYLFGIGAEMSTAYSLFIVGSTALVGGIRNATLGNVNYKTAVVFTIPAFIAVYATRAYLVPAIPNEIMTIGTYVLTKDIAIMVFFALVMLAASVSMIRDTSERKSKRDEDAVPVFQRARYCYRRCSSRCTYRNCRRRWWIFNYSSIGAFRKITDEEGCWNLVVDYRR